MPDDKKKKPSSGAADEQPFESPPAADAPAAPDEPAETESDADADAALEPDETGGGVLFDADDFHDHEESSAFDTYLGEAVKEEEHVPPEPKNALLRGLHYLYFELLAKVETAVIICFLAGVVLLPLIEIINRNSGANFWDGTLATRISYMFTFYVGLYGGVFATRYARHIAIDVVTPYLKPNVREKLSGVLFVICAFAAAWLTLTAYRFVYGIIAAEDRMFPGVEKWWGNERLWKVPLVFAFALMTLHFGIEGVRRLTGKRTRVVLKKKKKKRADRARQAQPAGGRA